MLSVKKLYDDYDFVEYLRRDEAHCYASILSHVKRNIIRYTTLFILIIDPVIHLLHPVKRSR